MENIKNYAFIKNDIVINIAVFSADSDIDTISKICTDNGGDRFVDCDLYPNIGIGHSWHINHFRPPKPRPSAVWTEQGWDYPVPRPIDAIYSWNEETVSWDFVRDYTDEEING